MTIRQRGHQATRLKRLRSILGDHENNVRMICDNESRGGLFSSEYWKAHAAWTKAFKAVKTAELERNDG